jgi:hypothetical protein
VLRRGLGIVSANRRAQTEDRDENAARDFTISMSLTAPITFHLSSVRFLAAESIGGEEKIFFTRAIFIGSACGPIAPETTFGVESGKPAGAGFMV